MVLAQCQYRWDPLLQTEAFWRRRKGCGHICISYVSLCNGLEVSILYNIVSHYFIFDTLKHVHSTALGRIC